MVKNAFKEESKVFESPERNLFWTDVEVQLLLESVRNSKTQKVCGSTTLFDPTAPCVFLKHISLFLRQMQNYFSVLPKLRTSLTYVIALWKVQSKNLSFKNHKCTYYESLLRISLFSLFPHFQRLYVQFFLYNLQNSSEAC